MPRYLVERTFRAGLGVPLIDEGAQTCKAMIATNAEKSVTWVHSYVSEDGKKSFCICDAPSPEAIRQAAEKTKLPVDRMTWVNVLDPYFYR